MGTLSQTNMYYFLSSIERLDFDSYGDTFQTNIQFSYLFLFLFIILYRYNMIFLQGMCNHIVGSGSSMFDNHWSWKILHS